MGWRCKDCGNTESFTETNKVETFVSQEKNTTKIKKVLNKYVDEPLLEARCNACNSKRVTWVNIPHQPDDYLFEDNNYVTDRHTINTIVFELTNKCDADCVYCLKKGNEELDFNLVRRIVDESLKLRNPIKYFELGWDAGNPLMHSRIKDILNLFDGFDCKVNILTNGKKFVDYIKNLDIAKNVNFTFFLDYPNKEENDKIMGKEVFSNTLESFDYLKKKHIGFGIYMRLSRYNYNKISEMRDLAQKSGAESLTPIEVYPLGETSDDMLMNDEMKHYAIRCMEQLNIHKSVHFSPALLHANCTYQRKLRLFIDVKGNLSFCHFLSPLHNSKIVDAKNKLLLELIQTNNKVRQGFLKNKERLFVNWKKPRSTASPCSYCLHAFGLNKKW